MVNVGVVSLVKPLLATVSCTGSTLSETDVMLGAAGALVSMVIANTVELALALPARSVAITVKR